LNEVLLRAPAKKELEQEAEMLAALIQYRVIEHERIQQLSVAASSNEDITDHLQSLGLV
jgi:coenzyme F420-reducing hydrogenase delta subunit